MKKGRNNGTYNCYYHYSKPIFSSKNNNKFELKSVWYNWLGNILKAINILVLIKMVFQKCH